MPTNRHWPPLAKPPELATDDVHAWAVPLDVSQQRTKTYWQRWHPMNASGRASFVSMILGGDM